MTDKPPVARRRLLQAMPLALPALAVGGCATTPPPGRVYVVFFEPFSAVPDVNATTIMLQAAEAARQYANDPVQVIGFADPEGASEENRRLSQARAEAVSAHLAQRGVAPARIRRSARGATEPTLAMVESRRVEIRIGAPEGGPTEPYRG
jgi:flagellar motor protein MotB